MSEEGIPDGYRLDQITADGRRWYRGRDKIVVTGTPPDDEHLPEEERHNCDAMGCNWEHVIQIIPIAEEFGYVSPSKPQDEKDVEIARLKAEIEHLKNP